MISAARSITGFLLLALPVCAAGIGPCTDGANNETILPVW